MSAVISWEGLAIASETITPGNNSTGITQALMTANVIAATISVEGNTIHFSESGVDPTPAAGTNIGHSLFAGNSYTIVGRRNVQRFRCIDRVSGSAGVVKVTLREENVHSEIAEGGD